MRLEPAHVWGASHSQSITAPNGNQAMREPWVDQGPDPGIKDELCDGPASG